MASRTRRAMAVGGKQECSRKKTGRPCGRATLLAVEIVRYANNRGANSSQTPMSAVVYLEAEDGSVELFQTGNRGWRASLNASGNWKTAGFDDSSWKEAIRYVPPASGFESAELGNPCPTGSVKALRRGFEVAKPV